jgi:phosphoribosylformylglycinamidine cyclo-ligase
MYSKVDYDVAGTVVGIVEKKRIIDKRNVKPGDILIGLASNGLHTKGYSLARKVLLKKFKL